MSKVFKKLDLNVLPLVSNMDMAVFPKLIAIHLQWVLSSLHLLTHPFQFLKRLWSCVHYDVIYFSKIAETIWNGAPTRPTKFVGARSSLDSDQILWHLHCQPKFVVEWWVIIAPCNHWMLQVDLMLIIYCLIGVKWVYPLHLMSSLFANGIRDLDNIALLRPIYVYMVKT